MSDTVKHIVYTVIAVVVTGALTWFATSWGEGTAAVDDAHIRTIVEKIVEKEMELDTGMNHAQAINQMNTILTRMTTKIEGFDDDIQDMRNALRALAREQ